MKRNASNEGVTWVPQMQLVSPSLGEIARRAKVSRSTVSRVMSNDSRISQATAERVRAAAKLLGYRPNPLLSTLMERVRLGKDISYQGAIGLVTDAENAAEWFKTGKASWANIHAGASQRAQERGYKIEYFCAREFPPDGRRLSQILETRDIHGVYITPGFRDRRVDLDWSRFSAATTGHGLATPKLHRVCYHNYHGIQIACLQLRALGYRRIGLFLGRRINEVTDQNYLAGFLLFLETVPLRDQIRPSLVSHYSSDLFSQWFLKNRPDAVIGSREEIIEWARGIGFRSPEDFGFVHLDVTAGPARFAGIDHNSDLVGRGVVDLIIAQVQRGETGVPVHPTTTMVEGFWVNGASVRPMADPIVALS